MVIGDLVDLGFILFFGIIRFKWNREISEYSSAALSAFFIANKIEAKKKIKEEGIH